MKRDNNGKHGIERKTRNEEFPSVTFRVFRAFSFIIPIAAAICFACWWVVSVNPTHAADDAEPEILNQAWRLAQGESIYRTIDEPPYVHTAYPPVYFAIVAALLKFTGLNYLPAKLVSFLAALSIGGAFGALNRRWQGSARRGVWMFFLLLLLPAVFFNAVRAHAQMLAVALSLWSFVFFMRRDRVSTITGALLAALAVYTKQTQIVLPLAMIGYLVFRDRARLWTYAAPFAAAVLIPYIVLQQMTGGWFRRHTVELNVLSYDVPDIPLVLLHHAGPLVFVIALAVAGTGRRIRERRPEEIDFYFIAVAAATVVACGRLGAHAQYVVELCVVSAAVLLRRESTPKVALIRQAALLMIYAPFFVFFEEGRFVRASLGAASEVRKMIDSAPGPVLAQQAGFALFARGGIHIQLFHFTALARAGMWNGDKLRREIQQRRFAWVVTEFPIEEGQPDADDLERFTPEVIDELKRGYRRAGAAGPYFIYRPAI